nr:Adenylosuccinate lyase [Candidatus Pantoea persica]
MAKNYYDITLALAGICQASHLVQQLAHQGQCQPEALNVSLRSVIDLNPGSTLAMFGNDEANLRLGLETLMAVLNSSRRQGAGAELTRYTLSMVVLEHKLSGNKAALATLAQRISQLDRQLAHYELSSETITSAMAGIYGRSHQLARAAHSGHRLARRVAEPPVAEQGSRHAAGGHARGGHFQLQLMFSRQRLLREAKTILSRLSPAY